MKSIVTLAQMRKNEKGKLVRIENGTGLVKRLESMGLWVGKKIERTTALFLKGPITVRVGSTRIALGRGIAEKIFVEVER